MVGNNSNYTELIPEVMRREEIMLVCKEIGPFSSTTIIV